MLELVERQVAHIQKESMALLPLLGLLIYHVLGPQRIRRTRLKRLAARSGGRGQVRVRGRVARQRRQGERRADASRETARPR